MAGEGRATAWAAALLAAAAVAALPPTARAEDTPRREPGAKSAGRVYAWTSKGGLEYEYRVPKDYDPERGANLVFVCHGTGLDRRWTFWNHDHQSFRPDDIVVSADGPTPVPNARLYGDGTKDVEAIRALQTEMEATFKVRQVFVYGHSQGAFFAFLYAGHHPDDVDGIVAHAGGIWTHTPLGPKNHRQALVLMHGSADPVVPISNSVGGFEWLREREVPLAHLRALEGWPHAPEQLQASQALAFCEGITTDDPARAVAALEEFRTRDRNGVADPSGWYRVAKRVAAMEGVPPKDAKEAEKDAAALEALAAAHAKAITAGLGKGKGDRPDGKPWAGHLLRFLRDFHFVPARDALAKEWEGRLDAHRKAAVAHLRDYYRTRRDEPGKAFGEAVLAVRKGFLHHECSDGAFLAALEEVRKDAKRMKVDAAAVKAYDEFVVPFRASLKEGLDEYVKVNRKN